MGEAKEWMDYGPIQRLIGPNVVTKVIDFMTTYNEFDYSINEIAENIDVNRRSVSRVIPVLKHYDVISFVRKIDRAQMFRMNRSSEIGQLLCKLSKAVAEHDVNNIMDNELGVHSKKEKLDTSKFITASD